MNRHKSQFKQNIEDGVSVIVRSDFHLTLRLPVVNTKGHYLLYVSSSDLPSSGEVNCKPGALPAGHEWYCSRRSKL